MRAFWKTIELLMRRLLAQVLARQQRFHHRHAHGDPHFHLLGDHALRPVGDLARRSRRRGSSGRDA